MIAKEVFSDTTGQNLLKDSICLAETRISFILFEFYSPDQNIALARIPQDSNDWQLVFTKQAEKDARKIASSGLGKQVSKLLDVIKNNPYESYPPYEKLTGDLQEYYSRRINIQHRLVYQIFDEEKTIKVIR